MSDVFKRNWPFLVAALAIAVVVHLASVVALPRLIMGRVLAAMSHSAGVNTISYNARPSARSRMVVRPSPDLLYASCAYDLGAAHGALRVHTRDMPKTYWSVSLFDADTDNFYVVNDRHAKDGAVDFLVVAPGTHVDSPLPQIVSPTARGIVLFRTLINDETHLAQIDAGRRHAGCAPYAPG